MKSGSSRAQRVIEFIERYCPVPEGALVGQPIRLLDFQKRFIRDVYGNPHGTRKAYLSIGRKNGKSALIACLVLAHLVGPEAKYNSQIISGAMSRDQAALVFDMCCKIIAQSQTLQARVRIVASKKTLIGLKRNVTYRAIAAEGKTAHGLSPVLAILDEIGQIKGPKDAFIDAVTTAQGAHAEPLLIAISTQAAEDGDLFSLWLDDAAKAADPHTISHVYAAPPDCDISDPAAWKAANPALGVFLNEGYVRNKADEAKRMPSAENTFRNLMLNQRVSVFSPFMSPSVWKANGSQPKPLAECVEAYAGLDLSYRADLTAFVMIGKDADGHWHVHPYFWTPEKGLLDRERKDRAPYSQWVRDGYLRATPGAVVDYGYVAREIADLIAGLNVKSIAFDRYGVKYLEPEFQRIGVTPPLEPFGQGFASMGPAVSTTEAEFLSERVHHGMHPVLTMCAAGAVVVKDPAGNRKLDKNKATSRIDGMVAMVMAFGVAGKAPIEPNVDWASQLIFC